MPEPKRIHTFRIDANSVQGVEGATITSKAVLRSDWKLYGESDEHGDEWFILKHVTSWSGILDANGKELPSPKDEPGALDNLYMHESGRIARLIAQGPDGPDALKN